MVTFLFIVCLSFLWGFLYVTVPVIVPVTGHIIPYKDIVVKTLLGNLGSIVESRGFEAVVMPIGAPLWTKTLSKLTPQQAEDSVARHRTLKTCLDHFRGRTRVFKTERPCRLATFRKMGIMLIRRQ